jgi:septal ring factor EnvC (AmiA/AmiB activator)
MKARTNRCIFGFLGLGMLCLAQAAFAAAPAPAANPAPAPPGGSLADRYQNAAKALREQRATEDQTRAERDRLAAEAKALQDRLIANAAKVQALEAAYARTEGELAKLNGSKAALEADLARDRTRVAHLVAVLQRLDTDMPPALALRPDDSLAAARGTMLMGAMLPPVFHEAAGLSKLLKTLAETTQAVQQSGAQARAEASALTSARADLDRLMDARSRDAAQADTKLAALHGVTEEIAHETSGLKSLIDRIAGLRADGRSSDGMTVVLPGKGGGADIRRGSLREPVVGVAIPGDPAGPGRTPGIGGPAGLWFESAGLAEAVAPADSEVVFAGAYQKFGQVLILEIIGGYHLTLAGLGRIDVHIGDRVLAGEPVGILPVGKSSRLYMELRRNGQTVDLAPWMSAALRKAKGT